MLAYFILINPVYHAFSLSYKYLGLGRISVPFMNLNIWFIKLLKTHIITLKL